MKISDLFAQFRRIEPDPHYTEHSKREVLASLPHEVPMRAKGIMMFLRTLESGVALVLAGFFIVLAMGGFSGTKLEPVQYAVIDPSGLQAEAQAIDIQIKLANLDYSEVTSTVTSTAAHAAVMMHVMTIAHTASSSASSSAAGANGSSTASTTLTVDQALQALSQ
jgi:hypothetical protein